MDETRRSQWIYYSLNTDDKPYLHGILEQLPSMKEQISAAKQMSCN